MTVEADILQLQQDLVNLQAALENARQTLQDQITFNVAGINEADTSADVATAATYVNAQDLTELDVTLRLYIDSQLDQLLVDIASTFNENLASASPSIISEVTTEFTAQVNAINSTIIAKTTEANSAAASANQAYEQAATIFDSFTNNDLPGFENRISATEIIAQAQQNTLNALLTDFNYSSIKQGFDDVDTTLNNFSAQLVIDTAAVAADAAAAAQSAIDAAAEATAAALAKTDSETAATAANTSASHAATSETNAGNSATAADASATVAATEAGNASTSAANAATSETNALGSANAAATSASTAATSETNAGNSATAAATSATNAASSATEAATSASSATTSATNAATSEANAGTSETNAAISATNAGTSETNASQSATAASTSETNAATSASNAFTSETNAATSATNAATSETNASTYSTSAATSATDANTYATNAETSATAAATSATNAETSATSASTSETNAATSASNASTSETNAATSATNAATSETNASTYASNAATSETNAGTYATNAQTSATNAASSETNASESASAAATSATSAATSASNASISESNAATSETNAAGSASNAATSAETAATSATNAGNSATAASTSETNASTYASNASDSADAAAASATSAASTYANITNDATGIQAAVDTLEIAVASLETGASAGYLVKAQANGTVSLLSLVAADDGVSTPTSIAKIQADNILLDGTVTAKQLHVVDTSKIFQDTFESDTSIDQWNGYSGSGEMSIQTVADAEYGGKVLRIGNNSGNDERWLIHNTNIPFDSSAIYRIRASARRTAGSGLIYVGFAGIAADGTTLVNVVGGNSYGSQHYHGASSWAPGAVFTETVGYTSGWGNSIGTGYTGSSSNPSQMHPNVRYIRPLLLVNYSGAAGTVEIDHFTVDIMADADLIVDGTITGTKIQAQSIDTVNLATGSIKTESIGGYEVKTSNLAPNAATTSVVNINSPLSFTSPSSAILGGRNGLSDFTTTGFYIGRTSSDGSTADGFQLSHTSLDDNNDITGIIHDGINGFRIVNPTFLAQATTSTPNIVRTAQGQTITLLKGTVHTVTIVGAGGGGGGASWESSSKTGTYHGTAGSAGGNTTVTLSGATGYSGTTSWTATGGAGGARGEDNTNHWTTGTGTTANAPDGENAGYGDGGIGGAGVPISQSQDYPGNNGGNAPATNYGAGGGGGSSASNDMVNEAWWGNPGGGGQAGQTLTFNIDLTSATTDGTLTVSSMGAGGTGGAGYSTSGDGGNGAGGVVILNSELDQYGKFTLQDLLVPIKQNTAFGGSTGIQITAFTNQTSIGGTVLGPFTEDKYFRLTGSVAAGYSWQSDTWQFILYSANPSSSTSWANTQNVVGNGVNFTYSSLSNGYTTPTSGYSLGLKTPGTLFTYTTLNRAWVTLSSMDIIGFLQAGDEIRHVGQWSNQYTNPQSLYVNFYGLGVF